MTVESTSAFIHVSAHHKIISFEILLIRCMYMFMLFRVLHLNISSDILLFTEMSKFGLRNKSCLI